MATTLELGTAIVSVSADLTKLFAGFEEAKAARDAFDRAMVQGSDGLLKFNAATRESGAGLSSQAEKTKAATDATRDASAQLDKMTAAQKAAADASKATSAAIETETQKTERLSQMVARSIEEMNRRDRLVPASGRSFGGGARDLELEAAQARQMGLVGGGSGAGGKIAGGVLDGAGTAAGATVAAKAIKAEAEAIEELGTKTHVSSGAIREFLVLIREGARGDVNRMAGSASILAQQLGVIQKVGLPLIGTFGLLAAAVGAVGYANVQGSIEANHFANELALSGNRAGLTAANFLQMATDIGTATHTSIASNEELIRSLAKTGDFSREEMQSLTQAAQTWANATGDSAEDIVKDFERMAAGPTKYAEEFQHAHVNIITPLQLQAIRELEERGQKEEATGLLIKTVTDGIAANTEQNTNRIVTAWRNATAAVSDYFGWLQRVLSGTETDAEKLAGLNNEISNVRRNIAETNGNPWNPFGLSNPAADENNLRNLERQRDAMVAKAKADAASTAAAAEAAAATRRQNEAVGELHRSYGGLIDSQERFNNDVAKLKRTLADAERANPNDPLVKQLRDDLPAAIDKLRKRDLPAAFHAQAAAARHAASEANKLENAAAALERRRQQAIQGLTDERDTLMEVVPLYQNQALDLDAINRAKAITIALSRLKLTADSAEGRAVADLTGKNFDLNRSIDDETRKRQILDEMRQRTADTTTETRFLGQYGEEVDALRIYQEKLNQAIRDHIKLTPAFLASLGAEAKAQAAAQGGLNAKSLRQNYNGQNKGPVSADEIGALNQSLGGRTQRDDSIRMLTQRVAREKQILKAARDAGLKSEKEYQANLIQIDKRANEEKRALINAERDMKIEGAIGIAQSLESIAADAFGKQSVAYKVAFDMEKAFTIAKAALAIQQDISKAAATGFPENIPLIAMAVAEGATIISNIRSIALSFANGGMVRGPGSGTSDDIPANLSDGEFVVNSQSTAKYRAELEAINAGRPIPSVGAPKAANDAGPRVTINNMHGGVEFDVSQGLTMNDVVITARRVLHEEGPGVIGRDMGRPNSQTSKALTRNKNVVNRRT